MAHAPNATMPCQRLPTAANDSQFRIQAASYHFLPPSTTRVRAHSPTNHHSKILQDQERDLLRAFRARLFDVQTELDREKSKKDDSAAAWIQRSRQLEAEVDWAKEMADR